MKKAIGFSLLGMSAVAFCAYAAEVKVDFGNLRLRGGGEG